jgi:hypothetical protein
MKLSPARIERALLMEFGKMQQLDDDIENARIVNNLRRTIKLTELALALRALVVRQEDPTCDPMVRVMREIRQAKDLAWGKSFNHS